MRKLLIVDRLEGIFAVLEFPDRTTIDVPLEHLPTNIKAGDCFWFEHENFIPAPEESQGRRSEIEKLTQSMWND